MKGEGPALADIHLPLAPGWWPPAPGWWLLALIVLALLFVLWRGLRRHWRLQGQRRVLHAAFEQVLAETSAPGQEARQVAALASLLRRAALLHAPGVACLQGEDWLLFLDAGAPEKPFSHGPGRLLLDGPYRRQVEPEAARALVGLVAARLPAFVGVGHA